MEKRVVLYLMPHKIQKKRYNDMSKAAKARKIHIVGQFSSDVTHIVTEFETYEQAQRHLDSDEFDPENPPEILKMAWFTESIKAREPVEVLDHHRLPREQSVQETEEEQSPEPENRFPEYACQRRTPLKHFNEFLTSRLEILEKYADMKVGDSDYSRALAFRRASCVLKSLPFRVTDVKQLKGIKDIGPHNKRVIKEILEEGVSDEVEKLAKEDWFKKMKVFTKVFGIGPSTAKKWIENGWTSVKDAQNSSDHSKDWRVQWGLAFHEDLIDPVTTTEAFTFTNLIKSEAETLLPGVIVQLTGGFSRGKPQGHDIDILFTHPEEGKEFGFLPRLLDRLKELDIILRGNHEGSSFHEKVYSQDYKLSSRGQLDHFEKWLGICKLPKNKSIDKSDKMNGHKISDEKRDEEDEMNGNKNIDEKKDAEDEPKAKRQKVCPFSIANSERDWIARRVDFIISPYHQYYYALVGWIGSKQFNRDIRTYSQKILNRKLTSHGLYDFTTGTTLPAECEKDVFDNLNLQYIEPENRNC